MDMIELFQCTQELNRNSSEQKESSKTETKNNQGNGIMKRRTAEIEKEEFRKWIKTLDMSSEVI